MARDLQNFPNIIAPSSDYPSGRIKDDPGDGTGTPVDEETNGDLQQFFAKLLREDPDTTPNDLPDNTTNGFQLYEAFYNLAIRPTLASIGYFDFATDIRSGSLPAGVTNTVSIDANKDHLYLNCLDASDYFVYRAERTGASYSFTKIVDISNPINDICLSDTNLYCLVGGVGVEIYGLGGGPSPTTTIANTDSLKGIHVANNVLYVGDNTNNKVLRYNATTGAALSDLATGLATNVVDITSANNDIFVALASNVNVTAYDADLLTSQYTIEVHPSYTPSSIDVQGGNLISMTASATNRIISVVDINSGTYKDNVSKAWNTGAKWCVASWNELITLESSTTGVETYAQKFYSK